MAETERETTEGGLSDTVYAHLRAIARQKLAQERPGHTLQATALVHEAYMRMERAGVVTKEPDARYYLAAAEAMRRILIEHARARKAIKRGGHVHRVDWTVAVMGVADLAALNDPEEIEALDNAILRLQQKDARAGDVVRSAFYAGLGLDEVAETLGVSARSVRRDWEYARAWLLRELTSSSKVSAP